MREFVNNDGEAWQKAVDSDDDSGSEQKDAESASEDEALSQSDEEAERKPVSVITNFFDCFF